MWFHAVSSIYPCDGSLSLSGISLPMHSRFMHVIQKIVHMANKNELGMQQEFPRLPELIKIQSGLFRCKTRLRIQPIGQFKNSPASMLCFVTFGLTVSSCIMCKAVWRFWAQTWDIKSRLSTVSYASRLLLYENESKHFRWFVKRFFRSLQNCALPA